MKPLDRYTPGFLWVSSGVGVEMSYTLGDDCDAWGDSDKKFTVRVLIECDSSVEKLKIVTVRPTSNDNCEWSVRMLGAAGCPVAYPRRAQCARAALGALASAPRVRVVSTKRSPTPPRPAVPSAPFSASLQTWSGDPSLAPPPFHPGPPPPSLPSPSYPPTPLPAVAAR